MKPKLRFKEFSDEWQVIKLSNISSGITKGTTPKKYSDIGINFVKVENIHDNTITNINSYISENTHNGELKRSILKENDILFSIAGALGRTAIVKKDILPANTNQACSIIRLDNPDEIDLNYLINRLNNTDIKNYIFKCQSVGAQPNLSLEQVNNILISYPSKTEQRKIGNLLSTIDKKIELQSKKIEDLKLFKLSQSNLIKIDDSYKKISLKSILKEYNEKSTINNQYEILSSTAKGIFLQSEYFNKQAASENNIGYKILRKNQLVLSPQNLWMGNININNKYEIGIVSPSYKIFDINTNVINIEYFKNWIKSPRALYEYMISSEQGASIVRRNLNMDLFNEITLSVPNMNEQNKIGKMLSLIDNKILLEEDKYKKLLELKKGLMQKMFV